MFLFVCWFVRLSFVLLVFDVCCSFVCLPGCAICLWLQYVVVVVVLAGVVAVVVVVVNVAIVVVGFNTQVFV